MIPRDFHPLDPSSSPRSAFRHDCGGRLTSEVSPGGASAIVRCDCGMRAYYRRGADGKAVVFDPTVMTRIKPLNKKQAIKAPLVERKYRSEKRDCNISGCGVTATTRGMCEKHYNRLRAIGLGNLKAWLDAGTPTPTDWRAMQKGAA